MSDPVSFGLPHRPPFLFVDRITCRPADTAE